MIKSEIIEVIESLEMLVVIQGYTVGYLNSENRLLIDKLISPINMYKVSIGSKFGNKEYLLEELMARFKNESFNNVRLIHHQLMAVIIYVHDLIKDNGYNNKSPEFEFFRHVRNAIGHGNRFTFKNSEPKQLASFNGIVIESRLNGVEKVIPNFLSIGDVLHLLTFIKQNF